MRTENSPEGIFPVRVWVNKKETEISLSGEEPLSDSSAVFALQVLQ